MSSGLKFKFGDMNLSSIHSENMVESRRSTRQDGAKSLPFVEEDSQTDVVLLVEGKRLYTSRALLSMSSPVLTRMLQTPDNKEKREIPLEGKSYDNILELLYILHPAYQRRLSDHTIFMILSLAEEYQIYNLKQKCEESLLTFLNNEKQVTDDLLLKCLQVSDQYKLFALWTKCLHLCSKPSVSMASFYQSNEYDKLSRFLKSMLEAFKGVPRDEVPKGSNLKVRLAGRRDSTMLVHDTNMDKAYSNSFTQTKGYM